jgi:hypothetical protein
MISPKYYCKTKTTVTRMRHVIATRRQYYPGPRGEAKGKERKGVKREAVRAIVFLLALAVEEAGLALSNAKAVRGEKVKYA